MRTAVLLDIRALGADASDAVELAAALRARGHEPLVLVRGSGRPGDAVPSPRGVMAWPGLRGYRRVEREFKPDRIVRVDTGSGQTYWRLTSVLGMVSSQSWRSTGIPPTNWGVDPQRARRSRLALWDGNYVLCPTAVDEACGSALLAAFARVGEERPQLDLVVLAEPQRHLLRVAERLGIAARLHFAGLAARDAEWAWLAHAGAVAMVPGAPVSPGLMLRSWATGRPPVTCHGFPCAIWVDPGRTGWCCQPDANSLARGLREALAPGPALRLMMDVSRRLAAERTWEHAVLALDASLHAPHEVRGPVARPATGTQQKAA